MNIAPVQRSARRTRKDVVRGVQALHHHNDHDGDESHHHTPSRSQPYAYDDENNDVPQRHHHNFHASSSSQHFGNLSNNNTGGGAVYQQQLLQQHHRIRYEDEELRVAPNQVAGVVVGTSSSNSAAVGVVGSGAVTSGGYVLFPHTNAPQLVSVPRKILHPNEEYAAGLQLQQQQHQRRTDDDPYESGGGGRGKEQRNRITTIRGGAQQQQQQQQQSNNKFRFFHPVKKEPETANFVVNELSPVSHSYHNQHQQHVRGEQQQQQELLQQIAPVSSQLLAAAPPAGVPQQQQQYSYDIPMESLMSVIPSPPRRTTNHGGGHQQQVGRSHSTAKYPEGAAQVEEEDVGVSLQYEEEEGDHPKYRRQQQQPPPPPPRYKVKDTNGCYQPPSTIGDDEDGTSLSAARQRRTEETKKRQLRKKLDTSPSPESQQHNNQFRRIAVEVKQIEDEHMAARRRRKNERRSFEHYEAMHQRHAEDWRRVCDSTIEMQDDRVAIAELYEYDPHRPHRKKTKKPTTTRQQQQGDSPGSKNEDVDNVVTYETDDAEMLMLSPPQGRRNSSYDYTGGSPPLSAVSAPSPRPLFDTQQHRSPARKLVDSPQQSPSFQKYNNGGNGGGVVPLPAIVPRGGPPLPSRHPGGKRAGGGDDANKVVQRSYDFEEDRRDQIRQQNYNSRSNHGVIGAGGGGVRRSTQDLIAVMERRYHMMIERDNHRAEKRMHEDEKHQRRLDEEILEARHVVHQNIAKERRRDEAKQKAIDLQDERRKEIEAAIQLRDMKVKYTKLRQGIAAGQQQLQPLGGPRVARGGGVGGGVVLQGFSNIARRNHEMIAV